MVYKNRKLSDLVKLKSQQHHVVSQTLLYLCTSSCLSFTASLLAQTNLRHSTCSVSSWFCNVRIFSSKLLSSSLYLLCEIKIKNKFSLLHNWKVILWCTERGISKLNYMYMLNFWRGVEVKARTPFVWGILGYFLEHILNMLCNTIPSN